MSSVLEMKTEDSTIVAGVADGVASIAGVGGVGALISGGFVAEGAKCIVAVEFEESGRETLLLPVESVEPKETPLELLGKLSEIVGCPASHLTVCVYGLRGGIEGHRIFDNVNGSNTADNHV